MIVEWLRSVLVAHMTAVAARVRGRASSSSPRIVIFYALRSNEVRTHSLERVYQMRFCTERVRSCGPTASRGWKRFLSVSRPTPFISQSTYYIQCSAGLDTSDWRAVDPERKHLEDQRRGAFQLFFKFHFFPPSPSYGWNLLFIL